MQFPEHTEEAYRVALSRVSGFVQWRINAMTT